MIGSFPSEALLAMKRIVAHGLGADEPWSTDGLYLADAGGNHDMSNDVSQGVSDHAMTWDDSFQLMMTLFLSLSLSFLGGIFGLVAVVLLAFYLHKRYAL